MKNGKTKRSFATNSMSEFILQERANLITSHVITKSLQMYKDDPTADINLYNYGEIDKEIKKYQELESSLKARLGTHCLSNYIDLEGFVTHRKGFDDKKRLPLEKCRTCDHKIRQGQQSACGLQLRKSFSVDDDLENDAVFRMDRGKEFLTDSDFSWQTPFKSQVSKAQVCRNSDAFELGRGQHFRSVCHPRKKLFKLQPSSKLSTNSANEFLGENFDPKGKRVKIHSNVTRTHCIKADVDFAKDEGKEKNNLGEYTSSTKDCIGSLDLLSGHEFNGHNTTKVSTHGQQSHDHYRAIFSFANLFQGIDPDRENPHSFMLQDTCYTKSCSVLEELDKKLEILHTENQDETNPLFLECDTLPRSRVQTAPTSSFRQKEKISSLAISPSGNSELAGKKEALVSLQSVMEFCNVKTNISNKKCIGKSATEKLRKINQNDRESSLFPTHKKVDPCLSFDDSVLRIWGIDKALKCWKEKIKISKSIERNHMTGANAERHYSLKIGRQGKAMRPVKHRSEKAYRESNSVDSKSSPIGRTRVNLHKEDQHVRKVGKDLTSGENFSTNMLALVKKWREISKDASTSSNSPTENCLSSHVSQLKTDHKDVETARSVVQTKTLILNSYLKEVQSQLNSLVISGQMVKSKGTSEVAQTSRRQLFKEPPKKLVLRKPSSPALQRASASNSPRTPTKLFKACHSDSQILSKLSPEQVSAGYSDGSSLCLDVQTQFRCIHNTQSEYLNNLSSPIQRYTNSDIHDPADKNKQNDDLDSHMAQSEEELKDRKSSDFSNILAARRLSKYLLGVSPTSDDVFFAPKSLIDLQTDVLQGNTTEATQDASTHSKSCRNFYKPNVCNCPLSEESFNEGMCSAPSESHLEYIATSEVLTEKRNKDLEPNYLTLAPLGTSFITNETKGSEDITQLNTCNCDSNQGHTRMRTSLEEQTGESTEPSNVENVERSKSQEQLAVACPVIYKPFPEADHVNKIQHSISPLEVEVDPRNNKDAFPQQRKYSRQGSFRKVPYKRHKRISLNRFKERLSGLHKMPTWITAGHASRSKAKEIDRKLDNNYSAQEKSSSQRTKKSPSRSHVGSVSEGLGQLLPLHSEKNLEGSLTRVLVPGVLSCAQAIIGGCSSTAVAIFSPTHRDDVRRNSKMTDSKTKIMAESSPDMLLPRPLHPRIDELKKGEDYGKLCRKHSWLRVKTAALAKKGQYFRGYSVSEKSPRVQQPEQSTRSNSSQIMGTVQVKSENPQIQTVAGFSHIQSVSHGDLSDVSVQKMPFKASGDTQSEGLQASDKISAQCNFQERICQGQQTSIDHNFPDDKTVFATEVHLLNKVREEKPHPQYSQSKLVLRADVSQSVTQPMTELLVKDQEAKELNIVTMISQKLNELPKHEPKVHIKLEMHAQTGRKALKEPQRLKLSHVQAGDLKPQSSGKMSKLLRDQLKTPHFSQSGAQEWKQQSNLSTSTCLPVPDPSVSNSKQAPCLKAKPSVQIGRQNQVEGRRGDDLISNTALDVFMSCCLPCLK